MMAETNDVPIVPTWRMGPGTFRPDDSAAGYLSPQAQVEHRGRVALLDDITGTGFRLLTTLTESVVRKTADLSAFDMVGGKVVSFADSYRDVSGTFGTWLEQLPAVAVLIRPDFNIYGKANAPDDLPNLFADLTESLRAN